MTRQAPTRRQFLKITAAAGLGTLAGCSDTDTDQPTVSPTSRPTTEKKRQHSSDYETLQTAIDETAKSNQNVLIVDREHEIYSGPIRLRSNIKLEGGGGAIKAADNTDTDLLRPEGVSNVCIDGLTIDGRYPNSGNGVRCIGGVNLGSVSNLRITNCTINNAGLHAIEIHEKEGGTVEDVYVGGNTIRNCRSHGIKIGQDQDEGYVRNIIAEGNRISQNIEGQAIGFLGFGDAATENVATIGNRVERNKSTSGTGTNLALEENVRNGLVYGNKVDGYQGGKNGISVTKMARRTIVARNSVTGTTRGMACLNFEFFEPNGPPRYNMFVRNKVDNASLAGFEYRRLDGDLCVADNLITNCPRIVATPNDTVGTGYTIYNNGPAVSNAGLPQRIGNETTYDENPEGIAGAATWSRGSIDPNDSVQVDVSSYL